MLYRLTKNLHGDKGLLKKNTFVFVALKSYLRVSNIEPKSNHKMHSKCKFMRPSLPYIVCITLKGNIERKNFLKYR